jgi:hypothetical protein
MALPITTFIKANSFNFTENLHMKYSTLTLRNFILSSEKPIPTKIITIKMLRDNSNVSALKDSWFYGGESVHGVLQNTAAMIPVTGIMTHDSISRTYPLNQSFNNLTIKLLDDNFNELKDDPDNKISVVMELVLIP